MRTVAALVFENMAPLDLFGPMQVFNVACPPSSQDPSKPDMGSPLYRVVTVGKHAGPVATGPGGGAPVVVAEHGLGDDFSFDILLIPGGGGTRQLVDDAEFIETLKTACGKASIVASVCTGAALLAKTGLLDGKRATSNKTAWNWVTGQRAEVDWDASPRWVDLIEKGSQTGIITSAGVSAGIDMALALVADLDGEQVAENAAVFIEHNRVKDPANDNFSYLAGAATEKPGTPDLLEFQVTAVIPATPQQVYDAWVNSEAHSEMTGGTAVAGGRVGDEFQAWDGYISGKNLELEPGRRIRQSWRTLEFDQSDADSEIEVLLNADDGGTKIVLKHTNLPGHGMQYAQGWVEHYFLPMAAYFGG